MLKGVAVSAQYRRHRALPREHHLIHQFCTADQTQRETRHYQRGWPMHRLAYRLGELLVRHRVWAAARNPAAGNLRGCDRNRQRVRHWRRLGSMRTGGGRDRQQYY